MHTRKRVLAGVTAGTLALGVLALSPVSPASAIPAQEGSTRAYLTGSLVDVFNPAADYTGVGGPANVPGFGIVDGVLAAELTVEGGQVTVFGNQWQPAPTAAYAAAPTWDTISATDVVEVFTADADYTDPGDMVFLKSTAGQAATVTVKYFNDRNENGRVDTGAENVAAVATIKFVNPADVTVIAQTVPAGSTQAYTSPAFYALVLGGGAPLFQDQDGPVAGVSGLTDWTVGAFATLNNDPDSTVNAQAFVPDVTNPVDLYLFANGIGKGEIYAATTGVITVTGWFDPTGTLDAVGGDAPLAAPSTPPTGFKASTTDLNVVSQRLSIASSMAVTGTGIVLDGPFGYSAPLSTTTATFELTALRDNVMGNAPNPFRNTAVKIALVADDCGTGSENFTVNGVAYDCADMEAGIVVPTTTDANGIAKVVVVVSTLRPAITDGLTIYGELVEVNGQDAPEWAAPDFDCEEGNTDPFCEGDGTIGVAAQVTWNVPGRVSVWQTSGSIDGIPFHRHVAWCDRAYDLGAAFEDFCDELYSSDRSGGGHGAAFYNSALAGTTNSMTINLVDTFGNIVPGRTVSLEGDPPFTGGQPTVGGTTGANGSVTFGVPGRINGSRDIVVTENAEDRLVAIGTLLYKPLAQMTAGGIKAPLRAREWVSQGDDPLVWNWQPVTFRVKDSTGDPMGGVVGVVTTSRGVVNDVDTQLFTFLQENWLFWPWQVWQVLDLNQLSSSTTAVVMPDGTLTVWVASRTTGKAQVTLSIGGKTKTARVDFSNAWDNAAELTLTRGNGGPLPSSVAPKSQARMRVAAVDTNGNPLEDAYILVKVKGNARLASGGRQVVVVTGKNGYATFKVETRRSGSFSVTAKSDAPTPDLITKVKSGPIAIK